MIRILLADGDFVDTNRHTYDQAVAAREADVPLLVGGPAEYSDTAAEITEFEAEITGRPAGFPPERAIYPQAIASIEKVRS